MGRVPLRETLAHQIWFVGFDELNVAYMLMRAGLYEQIGPNTPNEAQDFLDIFYSARSGVPLGFTKVGEIAGRLDKLGILFGLKLVNEMFEGYFFQWMSKPRTTDLSFTVDIVKDSFAGLPPLPGIVSRGTMVKIRFGGVLESVNVPWSQAFNILKRFNVDCRLVEKVSLTELAQTGLYHAICPGGQGAFVLVGQLQVLQ